VGGRVEIVEGLRSGGVEIVEGWRLLRDGGVENVEGFTKHKLNSGAEANIHKLQVLNTGYSGIR
jgi:hypothetical protein